MWYSRARRGQHEAAERVSPDEGEALRQAGQMLRAGDENRWLAAQFAGPARARLLALFAVSHEIGRIPDLIREPQLGEIRLAWWRDEIAAAAAGGPFAAPALAAAHRSGLFERLSPEGFEALIKAAARLLYDRSFAALDDMQNWLRGRDGALAALSAELGGSVRADEREALMDAGTAYGLAVSGPRLAPHIEGAPSAARALYESAAARLATLDDAAFAAALHLALTPSYLKAAAPGALARRVRLFRARLAGRL